MKREGDNDGMKETIREKAEILKDEVMAAGSHVQHVIKKAVFIGGSIALGYVLYRQVACSKKRNSGIVSALLMTVASALATQEVRQLLMAGKDKVKNAIAPG